MILRERLNEIRDRRKAIGRLPWPKEVNRDGDYVTFGPISDMKDYNEGCEEDYEFVAHAPNDIDFLLKIIDKHMDF